MKDDDESLTKPIWTGPISDSETGVIDLTKIDDEDLTSFVDRILAAYDEYHQANESKSLMPVRRANFWKRANFWRKRANFWRRDLSS